MTTIKNIYLPAFESRIDSILDEIQILDEHGKPAPFNMLLNSETSEPITETLKERIITALKGCAL